MRGLLCVALLVAAFCSTAAESGPAEFYVSPSGNDATAGTADAPFATLERARDEVRRLKGSGTLPAGARVTVEGGIYSLAKPFELTAEDSGTEAAPIVYAAAAGESVRLIGGKVVTGFAPVTDEAVLSRLDEAARPHVLQADLKALGITDYGPADKGGMEVFFADKPMTLSRWPNEGFVRIVDVVVQDGHQIHGIAGSTVGRFVYEGERPDRWAGEKDPWLHGYWFWDWSDQRQPLESVDSANHVMAVKPPYHNYGYRKGQWYYAFNLLSELDAPGEWYVDRDAGVLYFYPPAAIDSAQTLVSVLPTLVTVREASFVTFRGFTLEAARGTALTMTGGASNRIAACTVRNVGGNGIDVSGGEEHTVAGCDLYDLGGAGIGMSGGDRTTLTPAGHNVENNHIFRYGRINRMYHAGIHIGGVGNRVAHNRIHDAPHMAIGFGGNDHVIEYNEIYRVCEESNDAGAMYAGRDWTMRGTVIRHNHLYDINGFEDKGCVGVYLDDMFCGTRIEGNLFRNVTRAAFIGGGRDCTVENNVFIDCKPGLHIDGRALNWAGYHADEWVKEAQEKGTVSGIAYNKPPYSERYPELIGLIEDEPKAPKGNVVARNISQGGEWDEIETVARPFVTLSDNLVNEDPRFVDAPKGDYRLKDDSPALKLGFKPIPYEKIGLYADDDRATWPVE